MKFQTVLMDAADQMDSRQVLERVRAELCRVSSHPRAIDVRAEQWHGHPPRSCAQFWK